MVGGCFRQPTSDGTRPVERGNVVDRRDEEAQIKDARPEPSQWWFAPTVFPLIAGTFGPIASAFSVCALAGRWRVPASNGGTDDEGNSPDNPEWLTGINAVQLIVALVSNLFLLLYMSRRVRVTIARPITIIGWYISSFTLVILTATASRTMKLLPGFIFSQAFYYAIFSAGLYFLVASLTLLTATGVCRGLRENDSRPTMPQRTLMMQTMCFLVYLLAGAAVYSHIEDWSFLDAVYWADVTLLTVGFGDFAPSTNLGMGLLLPYAIGGVITLGLIVGSIRSLVVERGTVKLEASLLERQRENLLKQIEMKNKVSILTPVEESSVSSQTKLITERERREMEFNLMRKVQERAESRKRWTAFVISASIWFVLWFAGAAVFKATETSQQWSYFEALYFAFTSLLTIGYGQLHPTSNCGKPFFVIWSILAIPALTILISNMGMTVVKIVQKATLWIGDVTILPGHHGLRFNIKRIFKKVTNGKLFSNHISEKSPRARLQSDKRGKLEHGDGRTKYHHQNDPEQRAAGDHADSDSDQSRKGGEKVSGRLTPKSRSHYHSILIKEISSVMKHLSSKPARKYSFEEWNWYLKLLGEDESNPATHKVAGRTVNADKVGARSNEAHSEEGKVKWSWLGKGSPLMGAKAEAEWLLERLTKTLDRELDPKREETTGDWAEGRTLKVE